MWYLSGEINQRTTMKTILLLLVLCPFALTAQTTRTTVMAGDFYNPAIWSPVGFPASGDQLYINHAVVLNLDIYYNAGQITINPGGSLVQDAGQRSVWIDGGGLTNNGTFSTHFVWVSNGGYLTNTWDFTGIDSLMVQADFTNSGTAGINDFWVMIGGNVSNNGTLTNTDSMFVQGIFTNTGIAGIYDLAFDEMASLNNSGSLNVSNNMHNQGYLYNSYTIEVANDFSNCNTQNFNAVFENDGIVCFGNDFLNCDTDTITGSGDYFVGNLSSNLGVFSGNQTFHTPTGALTVNLGTVQPSVTMTTGACSAGMDELSDEWSVFPNPTVDWVSLSQGEVEYAIYSITGELEMNGVAEDGRLDEIGR